MTTFTKIRGIAAKDGSDAENAVKARYETDTDILFPPGAVPGYTDSKGALWHYVEIASTPELVEAVEGIQDIPEINVAIVGILVPLAELDGRPTFWIAGGWAMVDTGERAKLLAPLTPVPQDDI